MSALPAVTNSRSGDFRLIRPLVYTSEEITSGYAEENEIKLTPCVCSHRTGTVRRSVRGFLDEMRADNPHVFENLLSAMGRIDTDRLLDKRFLGAAKAPRPEPELLPILAEETI